MNTVQRPWTVTLITKSVLLISVLSTSSKERYAVNYYIKLQFLIQKMKSCPKRTIQVKEVGACFQGLFVTIGVLSNLVRQRLYPLTYY